MKLESVKWNGKSQQLEKVFDKQLTMDYHLSYMKNSQIIMQAMW